MVWHRVCGWIICSWLLGVCELVPLFDIAQPTLSHHLKKLRDAEIVDSERHGLWAYYYVIPDALEELSAWLT